MFVLIAAISTIALTTGIIASASPQISIDNLFREMDAELNKQKIISDSAEIANVQGVKITALDFRQYKANVNFVEKSNGQLTNKTELDLLNEMIKRELTVQYALDNGISVSEDEISIYIDEIRKALKDAPNEAKEVQRNLIKKSGLSEEEYWRSEDTRNLYRRWILINKLIEQKYISGEFKTPEDFNAFQETLLTKFRNKIQINQDNLIKSVQ